MNAVKVRVEGAGEVTVSAGTRVSELLPSVSADGHPVLGAVCNNMVVPLYMPVITDASLRPLCITDAEGWKIYRHSLCFLLAKCAHELFPGQASRVRNSMGTGFYCTVEWADPSPGAVRRAIARLKERMAEAIRQDLAVVPEILSYEAACSLFRASKQFDKLNLLAHRNPPMVSLTRCGDFLDLSQQPLVSHLGLLGVFDLVPMKEGFVLLAPSSSKPNEIPPLPPTEYLFKVYQEHIAWGRIVGITTVGELNQAIVEKRADDFVHTVEALHDKKLGSIADAVVGRGGVRLVLVSGPSSAGKTTFSKRLVTHLRVNGCKPVLISTDDYFVGDDRNPRDASGRLDYEHIEAIDLPRLNSDLLRLMAGEPVRMRGFDFKSRAPFDREEPLRLPENGMIVMEGIHSLNPRLTADVPARQKFLVYVNALTQLGVDSSNRISTTDTRIIRRMVRDHNFRNRPPVETLRMWPSIARGEKRWIYPFQHMADAVFNSALDYELAVLKPIATLLLNQIKPWDAEYIEARRLSGILHNFSTMGSARVPGDSILREYIGGSQLVY